MDTLVSLQANKSLYQEKTPACIWLIPCKFQGMLISTPDGRCVSSPVFTQGAEASSVPMLIRSGRRCVGSEGAQGFLQRRSNAGTGNR